jgi:hypothetical protein
MALAAPLRFPFPEHLDEALAELNPNVGEPNEEAVASETDEEVAVSEQNEGAPVSEQVQVLPKNNSESLLNATINGILGIFKKPIEQPLTTPTLTPNPVIQSTNSEAKLKPIISSIINIFKERQAAIPVSNGRTAVTAVDKPDDTKLRTLISGIVELFKKKSAVIINPITNMPMTGQTLTPPDTKLKTVLKTVFELFKKPETVSSSKIVLTSSKSVNEHNLQKILDTVYKLFERAPCKEAEEDKKKNIEDTFAHKRPIIEYEQDKNINDALKYLEEGLHEFYEPIHIYAEEGSTQMEFVYKLKTEDASRPPIIRRRINQ